jgi:uncharacterized YccA/Bax inhibitor family protein
MTTSAGATSANVFRGAAAPGYAGLAFVALATVWGVIQVALGPPELGKSTTQEFASFYGDQGNRIALMLAALALALAGFALVWFLGGLRTVLRRAEGDVETLAATAVIGGTLLAGLLFVFNAVQVAVPWALEESDYFRLDPGIAQLLEGMSYLLAIQGALVAAVFVGATAKLFRRGGTVPSWVAWSGIVIAVLNFLLAFPIHGVSLVLVLPWIFLVSVLMIAQSSR